MRLANVATEFGSLLCLEVEGRYLNLWKMLDDLEQWYLQDVFEELRGPRLLLSIAASRKIWDGLLEEALEAAPEGLSRWDIGKPMGFYPPVTDPEKVIAVGLNYMGHAMETGGKIPGEVLFFSKSPSCLIGCWDPIYVPDWIGRVDPEGELAVVIGKPGRYIPESSAMDHVLGYTIFNDFTAREMQSRDIASKEPWFRSKSIDTFGPIGPCLVTKDEIPDPHNLTIETLVNGEVKQKDNTANLLFKIPAIISQVSRYVTLKPGDIIATGTPEGISPVHLEDLVTVRIEGLGELQNQVLPEPETL